MTDDKRDMWVNCKQCEHVWVALRLPMEAFAARTKAERETHCRAIRHGFKERRLLQAIFGERTND